MGPGRRSVPQLVAIVSRQVAALWPVQSDREPGLASSESSAHVCRVERGARFWHMLRLVQRVPKSGSQLKLAAQRLEVDPEACASRTSLPLAHAGETALPDCS